MSPTSISPDSVAQLAQSSWPCGGLCRSTACGLKLIMWGRVVRVNHKAVVAMVAEFREVRTAGR
jgi:hypothetical protein